MSPHNHARFNGSNINGKASYHSDQNELGLAFERGMTYIGGLLYTYSGLRFFKSRRIFKSGIPDKDLATAPLKTDGDQDKHHTPNPL
jgi:hypothetical protein